MRLFLGSVVAAASVNPVEKVVSMLKKLQATVEEEGKEEAAAYDKYACFCKEQADQLLHSTTRSQKKIDEITATIADLSAKINEINSQIAASNTEKATIEAAMTTQKELRETEKATYDRKDQDVRLALEELEGAITAIKAAGKKVALVQVVADAVSRIPESRFSSEERRKISSFLQNPGEADSYGFHSQDLIALLMKMLQLFKQQKSKQDSEETAARDTFDMAQQKRGLLKGNLEKNVHEMMASVAKLSEEKSAAEKDNAEETAKKTEESGFLSSITTKCENKATDFDTATTNRANELKALNDALDALKGTEDNYKAQKKLNLIEGRKNAVVHHALVSHGPAFVQVFSSSRGQKSRRTARVAKFLHDEAKRERSAALALLASKIGTKNPFEKVSSLINDLIAKLEQQGMDEEEAADFCDTEMTTASTARDTAKANVESLEADIARFEASIEDLKEEIKELEQSNADLQQEGKEADEIRAQEHADYEKANEECTEGFNSINNAMHILENYYALLQQPSAPEADVSHEAKSGESSQIYGMMQVIKSDFERSLQTMESQEAAAVASFNADNASRDDQKELNEQEIQTKTTSKQAAEQDLFDANEELTDEQENLKLANEALEDLKPTCVSGPVDFRERTERRNQEIDSLKNALTILEESTADVGNNALFLQKRGQPMHNK
jgi:chromosome segregation ATPase